MKERGLRLGRRGCINWLIRVIGDYLTWMVRNQWTGLRVHGRRPWDLDWLLERLYALLNEGRSGLGLAQEMLELCWDPLWVLVLELIIDVLRFKVLWLLLIVVVRHSSKSCDTRLLRRTV